MTAPMRALGLVLTNATEHVELPLPGMYPGVSMRDYQLWPAASNSRLSLLRQSPAHLKAHLDEPTPDAAHFATGRAFHSAVLEPDDFRSKYFAAPNGDRRTKAIKEQWEELEARWGRGYVFKLDDYNEILSMRDSVYAHPAARRLLTGAGLNEMSATWIDPETGLECKARLDRYTGIDGGIIVDPKSCRDASRDAFERSIYSYGYHRQAGQYTTGAVACRLNVRHFVNIAVEKERPYAVAVYRMTEGAIEAGIAQLRPLIARYKQCLDSGVWPGYSDRIEDVAIPTYAWPQIDNEIKESA